MPQKIDSSRSARFLPPVPEGGTTSAAVGRAQSDLTQVRGHEALKSRQPLTGASSSRAPRQELQLGRLTKPAETAGTSEEPQAPLLPSGDRSDRFEFQARRSDAGNGAEIVEEHDTGHAGEAPHGDAGGETPRASREGSPGIHHAPPPGALARMKGAAVALGKSLDLHQQITSRDDAAVLEIMRATPSAGHGIDIEAQAHDAHAPMSLHAIQHAIADLERSFLDALREDPSQAEEGDGNAAKKLRQLTSTQLGDIKTQIHDLMVDQPFTKRAAGSLVTNALAMAVGIAVPVLIKDAEYTALNTGFFAQTMVKLAGQVRTPTSGSTALMNRQMRDRLAIPTISAAMWAPTALKSLEKAGQSPAWMAGAAVGTAISMAGLFFGNELKEAANKRLRGHPAPSLQVLGQKLSPRTHEAIVALRNGLLKQGETVMHATHVFSDLGLEVSETLASQVALLSESIMGMADHLGHVLPAETGAAGAEVEVVDHSADRGRKMALVAVTSIIGVASTGVMFPSKASMADMGVDGMFNVAYLSKMALDNHVDYRHAAEELQAFVGLNLMVVGLMGMNHLASAAHGGGASGEGGFINAKPLNNALTALGMAALSMTMCGPASRGLTKLTNSGINGLAKVGEGVSAANAGLRERMGALHPTEIISSLRNMSGADMINFLSTCADNAISTLGQLASGGSLGTGPVPQPAARPHSVTLTELD